MYISLHICSPKWKCKVESTCFPVGWKFLLTPAVCEQTLRYGSNELSAPKGCKAGNEGIHISSGYELFPKKYIIYIYMFYIYIDDIWVYMYIYIYIRKPWKSETIEKNWYVSLVFWCLKRTCEICVCVFFRRKNAFTKNCHWNLRDVFVTSWFRLRFFDKTPTKQCPENKPPQNWRFGLMFLEPFSSSFLFYVPC